jgi:hypothetical protein
MSVKQKIKKISLWIGGIIAGLLIITSVLSYIYRDKIITFVTQELSSQLQGEIRIGKIDISFLSSFPNVSIQLHNIIAKSTPGFNTKEFNEYNTDTAFTAQKLSFVFNVIDFINERYIVQQIKVKGAYINLFIDSKGKHNMNFVKETNDTVQTNYFIELSKISIFKTHTHIHSAADKLYAHDYFDFAHISGKFLENGFSLFVDTEFKNHIISIDNQSFFPNLDIDTEISIAKTENLIQILKASIATPLITIQTDGSVRLQNKSTETKLSYNFTIEDIEEFMSIMPQSIATMAKEHNLEGSIKANGTITGVINSNRLPELYMHFAYSDGSFTYNSNPFKVDLQGTLTTKNMANLAFFNLSNCTYTLSRGETKLNGSLSVTDFNNPYFEILGTLQTKLEDISEFIQPENYIVTGNASGTFSCKGRIADIDSLSPSFFTKTHTEFNCKVTDLEITPPSYSPYEFKQVNGTITYKDSKMTFEQIQGKLKGANFSLDGIGNNMLNYILFSNQDATFQGNFSITDINIDPFEKHYYDYLCNEPSTSTLQTRINVTAKQVEYDNFTFQDVSCILIYTGNTFNLLQTKLKTMKGLFAGDVYVTYYDNNTTKVEANGDFKKVSAKELFKTFNNFDQTFLTESQISGTISTKFNMSTMLDKDYNPIYSSMKILSNVIIEDGNISNFDPFIEMGKKMKVEEFKSVSFTRIENILKIENDTLYIPNMRIQTNAFDMNFAGKHAINNNQFNYYITVFMKKTLSNMFKKKNEGEDFGEIEQNTDGNLKLPLRIYGNPDKYSIEYDLKTSKQNVKQTMERQKEDWKAILNKQSNEEIQEKPKKQEKPIDSGFKIEYD